jgi:hypothetical protein
MGPAEEDQHVVLAVTVYGRRTVWAQCAAPAWRRRRNVARGARYGFPAHFQFVEPYFDRFKLENFELKFKIAKYESCRPDYPLQLL